MLCRQKDAFCYYNPPVNALIVIQPLLLDEDLLMPLFCTSLEVHLVVAMPVDARWI